MRKKKKEKFNKSVSDLLAGYKYEVFVDPNQNVINQGFIKVSYNISHNCSYEK